VFPRDKQGVENEDLVETGISVETLKDSIGDSTWEYVGEFSEPKMSPRLNVDIRFVTLFLTRFRGRKRSGSSSPNKPSNEMTESNDPDGEGPALLLFCSIILNFFEFFK